MAARENQGYLIAVIILVLLSLVLALAAFLGLSKMGEYADNKKQAENQLYVESKLREANGYQVEILKAYIGDLGPLVAEVPPSIDRLKTIANDSKLDANQKAEVQAIVDSVLAVQAVYEKDKLSNAGSADDGQALEFTYKKQIENLSAVLAKMHSEYNIKVQQALLAEQDAQTKIAAKQTEVEQMQAAVDTLKNDLAEAKSNAAKNEQQLRTSLNTGLQELQSTNDKFQQYRLKSEEQMTNLDNQIVDYEQQNKSLKDKINIYEREVFDKPDGQVLNVASGINSVYIDLGRMDGLTDNRSFAIYDRSVTDFEKDQEKATVEVVNVMDHQSEARVTFEDPTNPILPGDYVLTATWDPGYAVPIALTGKFDLDNDGSSDLERLMQMIKRNGGEVVAYHDENGVITGEIDSSVRYLVVGEAPNIGPDANLNVVKAIQTMTAQAEDQTVQIIDLQKLLNRMGVRAKPKLERLDRNNSEFQPRSPSDSLKSGDR